MNSNSGNDLYNLNTTAVATMSGNEQLAAEAGPSQQLPNGTAAETESSTNSENGSNDGGVQVVNVPTQQSEGNNSSMIASEANMDEAAASATQGQGGTPPSTNVTLPSNSFNPRTSIRSSVTSVTTDDDISDAYRRVSKESLASHESLSDMLNAPLSSSGNNMTSAMNQQQQANLLSLLQRQQFQMGNLSMSNNPNTMTAAMAMMLQQQQQHQQQSNSRRNSLNTASGMMNPDQLTTMNPYSSLLPTTTPTAASVSVAHHNPKTPLLLIPPKKSKTKQKQTFAMKLMNILNLKECQMAIRWMPNGQAFCVVDSKLLVEKVLPVYFKEAKYTSFTRKLNRWGFKHYSLPINGGTSTDPTTDKEMSIYSHEKFLRDDPELCQTMDGGHRRRTARKDEERTRQFFSQLKPEVRDLLRQGGAAANVVGGGDLSGVNGSVMMDGVNSSSGGGGSTAADQLASQAQQAMSKATTVGSTSGSTPTSSTTNQNAIGLEAQLQQMQAMQFQLIQQQQQQQQQQRMDMSSFMSNNAAMMSSSNGLAGAMGGNAAAAAAAGMMNNSYLANQQGLMGMNMMSGLQAGAGAGASGATGSGGGQTNNVMGMRRTSLGFMPYLPTNSIGFGRRDSLGSVFSGGKIESTFDDAGADVTGTTGETSVKEEVGKEGFEPGTSGAESGEPSKAEMFKV